MMNAAVYSACVLAALLCCSAAPAPAPGTPRWLQCQCQLQTDNDLYQVCMCLQLRQRLRQLPSWRPTLPLRLGLSPARLVSSPARQCSNSIQGQEWLLSGAWLAVKTIDWGRPCTYAAGVLAQQGLQCGLLAAVLLTSVCMQPGHDAKRCKRDSQQLCASRVFWGSMVCRDMSPLGRIDLELRLQVQIAEAGLQQHLSLLARST